VTSAGWVNFVYMIVQVTIFFAFIFNPMPRQVVVGVGVLLIIYLLLINLQVHFIQQDRFNASATFLEMFVVLIITGIKAG
jgi:Flp pilus assembly protein TadB